jgi:hypothetical protein
VAALVTAVSLLPTTSLHTRAKVAAALLVAQVSTYSFIIWYDVAANATRKGQVRFFYVSLPPPRCF